MLTSRRNNCGTGTLAFKMTVLLRPKMAVDHATLKQHTVRRDVDNLARSRTRIWSHSTNDDRRWETMTMVRPRAMRMQIGAHHCFTFRIERACSFVEDQDARVVDECACNREPLALST